MRSPKQLRNDRLNINLAQEQLHITSCGACKFEYEPCNDDNDICEYCPAYEMLQALGNQLTSLERDLRASRNVSRKVP